MGVKNEIVKIAKELIKRKSVNPPGNEQLVASFIEKFLRRTEIEYEIINVKGRPNIIAEAGKERDTIILHGHMDVVPGPEELFVPQLKDGKLFGRGACDMKGAIAVFLQLMKKVKGKMRRKIVLVLVSDEERNGECGSKVISKIVNKRYRKRSLMIVGEPTDMKICVRAKGFIRVRCWKYGLSAHASQPWLGKNAIEIMCNAILQLKTAAIFRKRQDKLLGNPTINIGIVKGGRKINMVPDKCYIDVDIRILPGEEIKHILERLKLIFDKIEVLSLANPWKSTISGKKLSLLAHLLSCQISGFGATCDARFFRIPAIIFGPGKLSLAHSEREHIEVNELLDYYRKLYKLVTFHKPFK